MNTNRHIPNPRATDRARELRSKSTWPEKIVWSIVRAHRLGGLKFRRQHAIGPYFVDFYCHEKKLVVEIDGGSHEERAKEDSERTAYLERLGLQVYRVTNQDVMSDKEAVAIGIARAAGIVLM
jgi:very-short-patch-repair endonuclease